MVFDFKAKNNETTTAKNVAIAAINDISSFVSNVHNPAELKTIKSKPPLLTETLSASILQSCH